MPFVMIHMKSRNVIPALHPWTASEWMQWIDANKVNDWDADVMPSVLVCDENGHQYIVPGSEVEYVMLPLQEGENDGK